MENNPSEISDAESPRDGCRLAFFAVLIPVLVIFVVPIAFFIAYSGLDGSDFKKFLKEHHLQIVAELKKEPLQVPIYDIELLEMLIKDPQCVENAIEIVFFMADLSDPRFLQVNQLSNLQDIGFIDCFHADKILPSLKQLDSLYSIYFEVSPISNDSIEFLAKIPNLKKVRFEQILPDETIQKLNQLLPHVTIELPLP